MTPAELMAASPAQKADFIVRCLATFGPHSGVTVLLNIADAAEAEAHALTGLLHP